MRRGLVIAALGIALLASASPSEAELPRGWWKGAIVLQEESDRLENTSLRPGSSRGSATLRIERTSADSATYDLQYVLEEFYGAPGPGDDDCRGTLRMRWTSTLKKSGRISVSVDERSAGASFYVDTHLSAPLLGTRYFCGVPDEEYDAGTRGATFTFLSKAPDDAVSRRGKATTFRSSFPTVRSRAPAV